MPHPTNPPDPTPKHFIYFPCGHRLIHVPESSNHTTAKLKKGTTWTKNPDGTLTGKSAHLFCPNCSSSLSTKVNSPPSYTLSCGHVETHDDCLQVWWALQDAGLVAPTQSYTMRNTACRGCETDANRVVTPRLLDWLKKGDEFHDGRDAKQDGPQPVFAVELPELARVLVYAQQTRATQREIWPQHRRFWAQVCTRHVAPSILLRFLPIVARFWGMDTMLDLGMAAGYEYYGSLRRLVEPDTATRSAVAGADDVLHRVHLIETLWAKLDGVLQDMEMRAEPYKGERERKGPARAVAVARRFNALFLVDIDLPRRDPGPMLEAGRALESAVCQSWHSPAARVNAAEAELIKGCTRLDRAMREIERWAKTDVPFGGTDLEAVVHCLGRAREEALRLWIGNTGIILGMVAKFKTGQRKGTSAQS
ncbi:hypothetical protein JX265_003411 [Neoarthrinium moseri]|uniref:Uncharacterized protein n=1 Tax=Neoarthrinium moseri TaxID=1658444 RepID=A0A9P9WS40_9PEZI|nr:hypothetical protein JX266_004416 [Neoarthrinium moseri]KAI1877403.1 hypothetical protein JX265_003411 [Neoarthrinium moseri]